MPSLPAPRRASAWPVAVAVTALALGIADLVRPHAAWTWAFLALAIAGIAARLRIAPPAPAAGGEAGIARPNRGALLRQGLRMGMTAFGGAMAVVAAIERELVQRLRWVTPEEFTEAAAFGQSLPGAVANNALSLLGFRLGGWSGALLITGGYVLPSFLLMLAFALLYEALRRFVVVDSALTGLSPAVVAVVGSVTWTLFVRMLARTGGEAWAAALWRCRGAVIVAVAVAVVVSLRIVGAPEAILVCGLGALALAQVGGRLAAFAPFALPFVPHASRLGSFGEVVTLFLRTGATTFGGGYVMVPVLERELVHGGWIGAREFMDAVAFGQITPGPVVITATFVGYRLAGLAGALFGTIAVFAPGFLLALALATSIDRVRSHPATRAFLAGLQPAVVGVMAAAVVALARSGLHGWIGVAVALVVFALLLTKRIGVGPALIGSALIGVALKLFGLTP